MKPSLRIAIGIVIALVTVTAVRLLVGDSVVALLQPHGAIASQERDVIVNTVLIMLVGAIPAFIVVFALAWKYRAGNKKAAYEPELTSGVGSEIAMWALPAAIIAVMWVVTWNSTHALDPFDRIKSAAKPVEIQVVALEWKWLFIYPEQGFATVNFVEFPADAPVHFSLTADAPVSSFWIPQLGSQIYAMAAMKTQLNLIAEPGDYAGKNMEINGDGYSGMNFTARSVPREDFDAWVRNAQVSPAVLDDAAYAQLSRPSKDVAPLTFASVKPGLFEEIMMKHEPPAGESPGEHGM